MLLGSLAAAIGCHTPDSDKPSPQPSKTVASATPKDISSPRFSLAAAGYFGSEASREAWDRHEGHCPGNQDGSEMTGRQMPAWHFSDWRHGEAQTLADLRGRVVVVRFWTAGCPFCEKSLPALQKLQDELADQPVTFIGAFHAKPVSSHITMERPAEIAESWKIDFSLALDPDWKTLRSWWLDAGMHRHATSVTFVIDKAGKLVHVHPGPEFYPSDDPAHAEQNADYLALQKAIVTAAAN